MNAIASPYFGRAAFSPDDFEPSNEQIAARAKYLRPLLAKSRKDVGELLATTTGTPEWEAFALALFDHDEFEAIRLAKRLMVKAVSEEAERIAEAELWRKEQEYDIATLRRIGAVEVWEWLRGEAA